MKDTSRKPATAKNYITRKTWNRQRPNALVVACSDGRLQENLDEFLTNHLGITRYDRLYAPGGPGALASSGYEYMRSDAFRREFQFLMEAHEIEDVYLIFHGPSEDGPEDALCADYRRLFPNHTAAQIREDQMKDAADILRRGIGGIRQVQTYVYRCEVRGDGAIQFVAMNVTDQ
jgi:hypothetical protein